jgi:hypothetical protein
MPTLEQVLEKFRMWRDNSARVQVCFEGPSTKAAGSKLVTAHTDGVVQVVEADGESSLVLVGTGSNNIHMHLTGGVTSRR